MSTASSVRPSRTGWWISALLFAAAVACIVLALIGFSSFKNQVNGFQRVSVPGRAVATFTSTGSYQLYYEGPNGGGANASVVLRSVNGGPVIAPVNLSGSSQTAYNVDGHDGQSVASFSINQTGRYVVTAVAAGGGPTPANVALGRSVSGTIFRSIGLIVGAVVLFFLGLLTVLITALRHRRTRRMAAPAQGAPMPSGSRR
jgi:hypothetical protein